MSLISSACSALRHCFQPYCAISKSATLDASDCCIGLSIIPWASDKSTFGWRNFSPPPRIKCCFVLSLHGQLIQNWIGLYFLPPSVKLRFKFVRNVWSTAPQTLPPVKVKCTVSGRCSLSVRSSSSVPCPIYHAGTKIISLRRPL